MSPLNQSSQKLRIVVVGAAGRLGCSLVSDLARKHSVLGLTHDDMDLGSMDSISSVLVPLEFDMLILCGALTGVDYCESHKSEAFAVNAFGPGRIAEISAAKGAHVTYISTDMVFDGAKQGSYVETDGPAPISVYGASKARGEELILAGSNRNLVVRVSWLYGPGKPAFPEWVIERACVEQSFSLPDNKICCSTNTSDLIDYMKVLLFGGPHWSAGIFHLCNPEACTWRDWGQFCIDVARDLGLPVLANQIKGVTMDSVEAFVAKRPLNSAMSVRKFELLTGVQPMPWQRAVENFITSKFSHLNRELQPIL